MTSPYNLTVFQNYVSNDTIAGLFRGTDYLLTESSMPLYTSASILVLIFIVTFMALTSLGSRPLDSFTGATWLNLFLAILLYFIGVLNDYFLYASIMLVVIVTFILFNRDKPVYY